MFSKLLKRILSGFASLIMVVVLITSIIYLSPVDPARLTFGQRIDQSALQAKKEQLGLDKSLPQQMYLYLVDISPINILTTSSLSIKKYNSCKKLISFGNHSLVVKLPNLRESYQTGDKVSTMLKRTIPNTIILALSSILIASILGILFGLFAALNKGNFLDELLLTISTLGYSVPSYVSAIFFAVIFGYLLKDFTGLNMQGGIWELNDFGDEVFVPKNLILPAIALGIRPVSVILQIARSAFLDTLERPYVLTAKAKGLSTYHVIKKHVLKNSLNPIITSISGWFASLLSGAFFVESVFRFKGLGWLTVNALTNYDIPVLLACILVVCSLFIFMNIFIDLIYGWLDPKVRYA